MRHIPKNLSLVFLFCLLTFALAAQQKRSPYEIGIRAGSFVYQGDLTPALIGSFNTPGLSFSINGSRKLTSSLSVRADLNVGNIRGDDASYAHPAWRQQRNF